MFCCSASKTQSFTRSSPEWQESGVNTLLWWSALSPGNKHFALLWARASLTSCIDLPQKLSTLITTHHSDSHSKRRGRKKKDCAAKEKEFVYAAESFAQRFDRLTYVLMEFAHDVAQHLSANTLFLSGQLAAAQHAPFIDNQGDKRKAITSESFPRRRQMRRWSHCDGCLTNCRLKEMKWCCYSWWVIVCYKIWAM